MGLKSRLITSSPKTKSAHYRSTASYGARCWRGSLVALVTQPILNLIGLGLGAASFDPISNVNSTTTKSHGCSFGRNNF
jgi:hypothetical protein